jgi:hypothetical protein
VAAQPPKPLRSAVMKKPPAENKTRKRILKVPAIVSQACSFCYSFCFSVLFTVTRAVTHMSQHTSRKLAIAEPLHTTVVSRVCASITSSTHRQSSSQGQRST